MKFLLLVLMLVSSAYASDESVECYQVSGTEAPVLKILNVSGKLTKVKITHADGSETIDENPEIVPYYIEPICHGTLSGRYLCTPAQNVSLYQNFKNHTIESLYFDYSARGKIQFPGEREARMIQKISCF